MRARMRTLALVALIVSGCNHDGGSLGGDGGAPNDAAVALDGALDGAPDLGLCPGDTPGVVVCGYPPSTANCRIDRCWSPIVNDLGFPPIFGPPVCLADGGVLPDGGMWGQPFGCDGPEDCTKPGEHCFEEEFSIACSMFGFDPSFGPVCHADCDCPSGQHCGGGPITTCR